MSPAMRRAGYRGWFGRLTRIPVALRVGVAVLVPAVVLCACGTKPAPTGSQSHIVVAAPTPILFSSPSATPSPSPSGHAPKSAKSSAAKTSPRPTPTLSSTPPPAPAPSSPNSPSGDACQHTFVPAYFYSGSQWTQAIDTKPAPAVMLLNVDNGVGTAPLSHFQTLVKQAQNAGITVLGYSSTEYGARAISSIEAEVKDYEDWYGVNGIFLDLTQATAGELSYYSQLASYIRSTVPDAVIWLNPGSYPDPSFMSIANVIMVFEGSYSSYLGDQVPSWVSNYNADQFVSVVYGTAQADLNSAISLSRTRNTGYLYITNLAGANPYSSLPSYWSQEAQAVADKC